MMFASLLGVEIVLNSRSLVKEAEQYNAAQTCKCAKHCRVGIITDGRADREEQGTQAAA